MLIGMWEGLRDYTGRHSALDAIEGSLTGELAAYVVAASRHERASYQRAENRQRGIVDPPEWSQEGLTEDEIKKRVHEDIECLAGREVLDYEIERAEDSITTVLGQAVEEQVLNQWQETEAEEERQALISEELDKLMTGVKLTPRLQLVANMYNRPDEEIASALREEFGKSVKPGTVRALKHDLLEKLRENIAEK